MPYRRLWEVLPGAILVALGVLFLSDTLGFLDAGWVLGTFWPLLLIVVGLLIIQGSRYWRRFSGGLEAAVGDVRIGDGEWDLRDMDTGIGVGDLRLDLTRARIPDGETGLRLKGGMGKIEILVPAGLAISARAEVGMGSIKLLGNKADGIGRQLSFTSPEYESAGKKVKLNMSLFMGEATVTRVG